MDLAVLFNLSFVLVVPFWLLLLVGTRWAPTRRIIASPWTALGPSVIYVILVVPILGEVLATFNPPTVAGVAALLGTPQGAALAYAHFIAFDYFVGRWMALDAITRNIHPVIMAPLLLATLFIGPVGFVGYLLVRAVADARRGAFTTTFIDPQPTAREA